MMIDKYSEGVRTYLCDVLKKFYFENPDKKPTHLRITQETEKELAKASRHELSSQIVERITKDGVRAALPSLLGCVTVWDAAEDEAVELKPGVGILEEIMDEISRHDAEHPDHGVGCAHHDKHAGALRRFFHERGVTRKSFDNFCTVWSYIVRSEPILRP